jgi:signal transduction histidine kinase
MRSDLPGHRRSSMPAVPGVNLADSDAWADMLSMIGQKNSRLYELIGRSQPERAPRKNVMAELERERSRIARELHAGAGQPLAGIKLNLEMLDSCADALPQAGRDALTRLQTLAEQALDQVRAVSHNLHPPDWQALTTTESIRYLINSNGLTSRLEIDMEIEALPIEPSHAVKIALYRCAQECISNILRHSGATRMAVSVRPVGDAVVLRLPAQVAGRKGIGLVAMREHAEALGGTCDVSSGPSGVVISVRLPVDAE